MTVTEAVEIIRDLAEGLEIAEAGNAEKAPEYAKILGIRADAMREAATLIERLDRAAPKAETPGTIPYADALAFCARRSA